MKIYLLIIILMVSIVGGEPDEIPSLTYKGLVDFHKKHYHPSNAIFFTYGNIDIDSLQNEIQTNVLSHFNPSSSKIEGR